MNLPTHQSLLLTASLCALVSACEPQPSKGPPEPAAAPVPGLIPQALSGPAPLLTSVSPYIGPATGGTVVTVSGKNFRPSLSVRIGGIPCSDVRVLSSTQVAVGLPASPGAFGLVPITVSQPDGKSVTRGDLFYYAADAIDFLPAYHYAEDVPVRSFLLQDLNKDGRLDLIATDNVHGNVVVLLGNGDGFFQWPQLTPVVSTPDSLVAADVNGDYGPYDFRLRRSACKRATQAFRTQYRSARLQQGLCRACQRERLQAG